MASKSLVADEVIDLEVDNLPEGAIFKGYQEYWVQDIIFKKKLLCIEGKHVTFQMALIELQPCQPILGGILAMILGNI